MSIRDWWRRMTRFGRDPYVPTDEVRSRRRTSAEKAARTGVRLSAEAEAKELTAQDMREMGMEEAAESLERDVEDLRERVTRLERQQAGFFVAEGADAFEGRSR